LALYLCAFAFTLAACADSAKYGRFRPVKSEVTIHQLVNNWRNYNVYWAGVNVRNVNAILFDPKDDDRKFSTQGNWSPVHTEAQLAELIRWINVFRTMPPDLYEITGPGRRFFGYVFMLTSSPVIRVVDEQTLSISNITERGFDDLGAQ
jgi:hypothetical protein